MQDADRDSMARLRQTFAAYDGNGDGRIGSEEFRNLLQALDPDLSADECLLAFEATDADGDAAISFEEFLGWWTGV